MGKIIEKLCSSKTIIRKQISLSFDLTSYVSLFFILIICLNFFGILYSVDALSSIKSDISRLDKRIEIVEDKNSNLYMEEDINNYYRELSDKTDEAIDRILSIVGLLATVTTFFGILLAFKAPRDIEKKMEENKALLEKAEKSAKDAKYQAEILEALNVDYDGRLTNSKRVQQISKIIKKYPEEPDAYMHRGFLYDKMAKESPDKKIKLINLAISDYEIARKLGANESSYYNDIGVAYSRLHEYQKAIWYYTKAIEKEPDEEAAYINRGGDYASIGEYQKSLDDLEVALKLNSESYDAYVTRNYIYDSLWRKEANPKEKNKFIKLQIADLERAIDINPEDNKPKELLEKLINELKEKQLINLLEYMRLKKLL